MLIMSALLAVLACGQTSLPSAKQREIVSKIDKSVSAMRTMQCRFTQSKAMKMMKRSLNSSGVMYYAKPDRLRWQYTSPYTYTFILNKGKAYMKSAKSSMAVDVNSNKMFKQVLDVVIDCVTGGNLANTAYFKTVVYKQGNSFCADLTPQKKEMRQVYSLITLCFNPSLTMVSKVVMKEKGGDTTTIELSDVKTNASIDEKVFSSR